MNVLDELLHERRAVADVQVDADAALEAVRSRYGRRRRVLVWGGFAAAVLVVLGTVTLVSSLSGRDDAEHVATEPPPSSTDIDDLVGVDWQFVDMAFAGEEPPIDLSDVAAELRFQHDGTYSWRLCNLGDGKWGAVEDGSLTMENGFSTAIGCAGELQRAEHAFFRFDQVEWRIDSDVLTLSRGETTVRLRPIPPVFPKTLALVFSADHPADAQYAVGFTEPDEVGVRQLQVLARENSESPFVTDSVESTREMVPAGVVVPGQGPLVAAWLPADAAKVWVELATGGAEIDLIETVKLTRDLVSASPDGLRIGFAELPEPAGVLVAFDAAGNEIARSEPFDLSTGS